MRKTLICFVIFQIFIIACKESSKERLVQDIKSWQGKEVEFPEGLVFTKYAKDTVNYAISNSKYKVLLYVDSTGCTGCKLKLHKWSEFMAEVDSLSLGKVSFLFFFQSKDTRELRYLLSRDAIDQPICVDKDNALQELNRFPNNFMFHCFLLDKNNRVLCIGNPVYNQKVRDLYLKKIIGVNYRKQQDIEKTKVKIVTDSIMNLGELKLGATKSFNIIMKNIGNNPLCIYDVETSCGCTEVNYNKEAIALGETVSLEIRYEAEEIGDFNKTIKIKCNTENSPIVFRIKGVVK